MAKDKLYCALNCLGDFADDFIEHWIGDEDADSRAEAEKATKRADAAKATLEDAITSARAMLAALKMAAHDLGTASGGSSILEVLKVGQLARTIDRAIEAAEAAGIQAQD